MSVENGWDEVWVAVKFQTNLEIAGSLRNSFRAIRITSTCGAAAFLVHMTIIPGFLPAMNRALITNTIRQIGRAHV